MIKAPVVIWAVDMALLLATSEAWSDRCGGDIGKISQLNVLQLIMLLSIVAATPFVVYYMHLVRVINRQRPYPDAATVLSSAPRSLPGVMDLEINDSVDEDLSELDVTERQAEMIRFLQTKNRNLSKQILELTQRVQRYEDNETNDGLLREAHDLLEQKNDEVRRLRLDLANAHSQLESKPSTTAIQLQELETELRSTQKELGRLKSACDRLGHTDKLLLQEEMFRQL